MFIGKGLGGFDCDFAVTIFMSYDSEGTTKVLYEPKTNYEIDRIEVMIDKSNHFILASKRTIMLLSGCLLARAWAALIATSLLPF
jgi:hypothetical protein